MAKLSDIYGIDKNDMAESIASKTLADTKGGEEAWGQDPVDQSAASEGSLGYPMNKVVTKDGKQSDGRATTKGNHGGQG